MDTLANALAVEVFATGLLFRCGSSAGFAPGVCDVGSILLRRPHSPIRVRLL